MRIGIKNNNSICLILPVIMLSLLIASGCGTGGGIDLAKSEPAGVSISGGMVRSKGFGISRKDDPPAMRRITAREAAYTIAMRNLLEFIEGTQIESKISVKDASLKDQEIKTAVKGLVKNVTILKEGIVKKTKDKVIYSVEVGVQTKEIVDVVKKDETVQRDEIPANYFQPVTFDKYSTFHILRNDVSPDVKLETIEGILEELEQKDEEIGDLQNELNAYRKTQIAPSEPTGIIVNAQNAPIRTNVYAKIYYPEGGSYKLLYGDSNIDRPNSSIIRWSDWEFTMMAAIASERVKPNPIVVDVILVGENSEPVIRAEDAVKIEELEIKYGLLRQGKVVFLTTFEENVKKPD